MNYYDEIDCHLSVKMTSFVIWSHKSYWIIYIIVRFCIFLTVTFTSFKKEKKMSFDHSQEVINDYEKVLETNEEYDVIIYAGENENVKKIYAHLFVLCMRSQYFRTRARYAEEEDGKFIFKIP